MYIFSINLGIKFHYFYYFLIIPFLESQRCWCHDESPSRTRWNKNISGKLSLKRVTKSSNFWSPLHPRELLLFIVIRCLWYRYTKFLLSFFHSTTRWSHPWNEKRSWMIWCRSRSTWATSQKPPSKQWVILPIVAFESFLGVKASIFCAAA